jgi:hypothetical protein
MKGRDIQLSKAPHVKSLQAFSTDMQNGVGFKTTN